MMIYKGKVKGHITTREFQHHDLLSLYACQDAAWMDEVCMLRWVDKIIKPYLKVNPPPPGIVPGILLDAYRCHMMASVIDAIFCALAGFVLCNNNATRMCQKSLSVEPPANWVLAESS
jgi:hypothetical protein